MIYCLSIMLAVRQCLKLGYCCKVTMFKVIAKLGAFFKNMFLSCLKVCVEFNLYYIYDVWYFIPIYVGQKSIKT